jgi:hypothetical protein
VLLMLASCTGHIEAPSNDPSPVPTAGATSTDTGTPSGTPPSVPTAPAAPTTPPIPALPPQPTPPTAATTPAPTPHELLPPLFAEPAVRAERAVPIVGGTLLVTTDGTTAVAADPDRDRIFLVDLASRSVRSVATEPGDEPGRVVEGPAGTIYVVARRAGAVLAVDLQAASVRQRTSVCAAPRGLAYDGARMRVHVACRSGLLVSIDVASGNVAEQVELEADLRDVIVSGDTRIVTRFRSAELLELDSGGSLRTRLIPPTISGSKAAVLFRAIAQPNGTILLAHQLEGEAPLGTGFGAYYGGSCFGGGVVQQAVSVLPAALSQDPAVTRALPGLAGPTDFAISQDGTRIALIASGNSWLVKEEQPTLFVSALLPSGEPEADFSNSPCNGQGAPQARYLAGEPVAVAFDAAGRYVVQSREPAMLELEGDIFINLSDESHFDSGFASFYLNTGGNISCASCHPEGGDDGHTWAFASVGYRRSQSLAGGVSASAPFHWSGDLANFENLFTEVMLGRMALPVVPPSEHVAALADWLDTIPAEAPADGLDAARVERGRLLFEGEKVACAHCHSGPNFTDGLLHNVGSGGDFITPSLRGVALRTPLMHDGCAKTLHARFGACGGTQHGDVSELSATELDDLVTFLRSL